ncbi:MAG TPA: DUF3566 domain-containing protein [Ilumatobacteraceae bacterium]|nr:DUF3566 domain-containing protein [Ilumatobacteraceae bacterium]
MSPSKRAGDTVDEQVDAQQGSANGNGSSNGDERGEPGRSKPRRRSVVSSGTAAPPERGTSSQRGTSSSSITKRGRFAEDEPTEEPPAADPPVGPVAAAPVDPDPVDEAPSSPAPVTAEAAPPEAAAEDEVAPHDVAIPPPLVPPTARVDPDARRPVAGPDPALLGLPIPVTIPTGTPAPREATTVAEPERPMAPPDPPYATSTMTSHGIAPVPRVVGRRPRVRRVTRVVRHVDPWSVFKIAIIFNLVLYGVLLTAGVLLWNVAYATGTVDNLERFFESFGWSDFEFDGGAIYHASWIAGLFGVVGLTGAVVLAATLFNLITDLVGGVRMTVLEEEVQERTMAPMRRFVVRRPGTGTDPSAGLRREVDRLPIRDPAADDPPV